MTTQLSELELIEDAMKNTRSTRMLIRYQVISLHLKVFYNNQIAEIVGRCEHTIGKYVNAYKSQGIGGLIPTSPPGAQRIIPTYGQHNGVKLLGVLDYATGQVYVQQEEHYDA